MKIREIISEARRNPEQNPKIPILEQLKADREKYGSENVYARFVSIPKFGNNPNYDFNTPLGMFAYPIDYLIANWTKGLFSSQNPYLYVFKADPGLTIWDINHTPVDDELKSRLIKAIKKILNIEVDDTKLSTITTSSDLYYFMYSQIGKVFDRDDINTGKGKVHGKTNAGDSSLAARKIMKAMGFDGAFDLGGNGVIASQDKVQVVFFNTSGLTVLDSILGSDKEIRKMIKDDDYSESNITSQSLADYAFKLYNIDALIPSTFCSNKMITNALSHGWKGFAFFNRVIPIDSQYYLDLALKVSQSPQWFGENDDKWRFLSPRTRQRLDILASFNSTLLKEKKEKQRLLDYINNVRSDLKKPSIDPETRVSMENALKTFAERVAEKDMIIDNYIKQIKAYSKMNKYDKDY